MIVFEKILVYFKDKLAFNLTTTRTSSNISIQICFFKELYYQYLEI